MKGSKKVKTTEPQDTHSATRDAAEEGALDAFTRSLADRTTLWQRKPVFGPLLSDRTVNPLAIVLRDRISTCRPGTYCLSAACSACARAFQAGFTESAAPMTSRRPDKWIVASIVGGDLQIRRGDLTKGDLFEPLNERLRMIFPRICSAQVLGGFDVCLRVEIARPFLSWWQPHAWLLIRGPFDVDRLRTAFHANEIVPRPVRLQRFDGRLNALDYALKPNFIRRDTLVPSVVKRRNTRNRPLRVEERSELALELHQAGLASRVFLRGISFDPINNRFIVTPR